MAKKYSGIVIDTHRNINIHNRMGDVREITEVFEELVRVANGIRPNGPEIKKELLAKRIQSVRNHHHLKNNREAITHIIYNDSNLSVAYGLRP